MRVNRREFLASVAMGAAGVAAGDAAAGVPMLSAVAAGSAAKRDGTLAGKPITGKVTAEGRPMAGVIVSDGLVCVRTDAQGAFSFAPRAGARFITVTTPSGYRTGWRSLAIPRKFQPYDFNLVKQSASGRKGLRFVQIADSEISRAGLAEKAWMDRVRGVADEVDAAFIVHTGDICRRPGLLAHQWLMNDATMGRPVIYCLGNHDLETGPAGESQFETIYGPSWYSFEAGGVHFCVTPMPLGDYPPSFSTDDVADWLRNDLALLPSGMPVVIFNHMISNWEGPAGEIGVTYGRDRKLDLLAAANLTGFVYGHLHHNRFIRRGKTAFVCTACPEKGGTDLSPESVRVFTVDGEGRLSSELRYGHAGSWACARAGARWETQVASPVMHGEPVVVDGLVMVGTSDEDGKATGGVTALDAETGREVWRCGLPGSVNGRMALVAGNLVVQDSDGGVYAFRAKDGAAAWSHPAERHPWKWSASGVSADSERGTVFAGKGKDLAAFDAATGRELWRDGKWPGRGAGEPCADASGCGEGVLASAGNWSGFFLNDARTGKLLWAREGEPFRFPGATPVVKDGKVISLGGRKLFELDVRTGKTIREVDVGAKLQVTTKVVETDDLYLFGSSGRGLVALDKRTLGIRWTGEVGESLVAFAAYAHAPERCVGTVPIVVGDRVVASATDGAIHFWNLSDGRHVKEIRTGAPYLAGVTVVGRKLFAADLAGWVRMFEI